MSRCLLFVLTLIVAADGCAVRALNRDQDQIRSALLDLYTNQIMDNLIRAHNGMPIIQMDYTNAQGTVTVKGTGVLSGGGSSTRAAIVTTVRNIMGSLTGEASNQVTVVGTPVTTHNEVYNAYLEYLSLPGSLMVTDSPPPPHAAHLCRRDGNCYYWIPREYARQFLRLSLLTTAERGQALLPPDEFYAVTIQKPIAPPRNASSTSYYVTLPIDKPIPNDSGYFAFSDSKAAQPQPPSPATISSDDASAKAAESLPEGSQTKNTAPSTDTKSELVDTEFAFSNAPPSDDKPAPTTVRNIVVKVAKVDYDRFTALLPRTAKVYLTHNRPKPPNIEDLLERANIQLQQIQLNQLRDSTNP
jgi:hypothetical protein